MGDRQNGDRGGLCCSRVSRLQDQTWNSRVAKGARLAASTFHTVSSIYLFTGAMHAFLREIQVLNGFRCLLKTYSHLLCRFLDLTTANELVKDEVHLRAWQKLSGKW
jgi:hypothetical protein